jgi:hypothetical protein
MLKDKEKTEQDIMVYLNDNKYNLEGEIALWQSVIMQAVIDVLARAETVKSKMKRAENFGWFSKNNQDFMLVCSLSELNADLIIKGINYAYKKQNKSIFKFKNKKNSQILSLKTKSHNLKKQTKL